MTKQGYEEGGRPGHHLARLEQLNRMRERAGRLLRRDDSPTSFRDLVLEALGRGAQPDGDLLALLADHRAMADVLHVSMQTLDDWSEGDLATQDLSAAWPVALAHLFGLPETTFFELVTCDLQDDRAGEEETRETLERFRAEWQRIRDLGVDPR